MIEIILIISLSVFTLVSIYNLLTAPVLTAKLNTRTQQKLVSILIPARNEEKNIFNCINSAINQTYTNLEIIVLDDNSTDKTFEIASGINHKNLKIIKGDRLPYNWLGKNWSCYQLAEKAKGNYLLFIDADVMISPTAVEAAVSEIEQNNFSLISVFPTQTMKSFGEYLIVPLMNWLLLAFLPLKLVYTSLNKSFIAANGQFMLWKKEDYYTIGGHQQVKNEIVEDMALAGLAKQNNLKIKTLLGGSLVNCRMYNSFNDAYNGFQKNFYAGFSINPILFLLIITSLTIIFTSPIYLGFSMVGIIALTLIIIIRLSISVISKQNSFTNILLHTFQMLFMLLIGTLSVIKYKTNKLKWKSRKL